MALWDEYWQDRGQPWEHDPGPDPGGHWAQLFAATPEYRRLSKQMLGRERFRWHFGPMFFRGRLRDGDARVLVIGQEGAQDESLAHRSFVCGTGSRRQPKRSVFSDSSPPPEATIPLGVRVYFRSVSVRGKRKFFGAFRVFAKSVRGFSPASRTR